MTLLKLIEIDDSDQKPRERLSMEVPARDMLLAVPAILAAYAALPEPKKSRADKGTKRKSAQPPS